MHSFAHETAGAARTRHSLRTRFSREAKNFASLGRNRAARSRTLALPTSSLRKQGTTQPCGYGSLLSQGRRIEVSSRGMTASFPQIVAIRFRYDLPAVGKLHRHQIVGEVARRQLATHLDEGGGIIGAVDGDDK